MRGLDGSIIIAALVLVTIVLLLVFRQDMKVSNTLAGLARRRGLKFNRKDRFSIRRTLNRTFRVRGSGRSYGWVRDIAHDSKIRVFRLNEVYTQRGTLLPKQRPETSACAGALFPAPEGGPLAVETDGRVVVKSLNLDTGKENTEDTRTRAVASYIKDKPAPHALYAIFAGDTCFAYLKPKKFDADEGEPYAYMIDLAYGMSDTKREGLAV